jgi:hypothetical protein
LSKIFQALFLLRGCRKKLLLFRPYYIAATENIAGGEAKDVRTITKIIQP